MATAKSKNLYVSIAGTDISQFCDANEHHTKPDVVDISTYGSDWHSKDATLLDGNGSIGGVYDTSAVSGPRAILEALVGTTVTYVRRVEGTGSGKPQMSRSVIVGEYVETAPVADVVRWTCALEYTGAPDNTAQA